MIGADAAIGVVTTASFALGLALFAVFGTRGGSFDNLLFGSILGVGADDVLAVGVVAACAGAVVFLRYRALLFTTFDPEVAEAFGVKVARVDALLMLVLAGSILVTMQVLGVTLIAAALVIPATVASRFWCNRVGRKAPDGRVGRRGRCRQEAAAGGR